jgi:hypothetical protein
MVTCESRITEAEGLDRQQKRERVEGVSNHGSVIRKHT